MKRRILIIIAAALCLFSGIVALQTRPKQAKAYTERSEIFDGSPIVYANTYQVASGDSERALCIGLNVPVQYDTDFSEVPLNLSASSFLLVMRHDSLTQYENFVYAMKNNPYLFGCLTSSSVYDGYLVKLNDDIIESNLEDKNYFADFKLFSNKLKYPKDAGESKYIVYNPGCLDAYDDSQLKYFNLSAPEDHTKEYYYSVAFLEYSLTNKNGVERLVYKTISDPAYVPSTNKLMYDAFNDSYNYFDLESIVVYQKELGIYNSAETMPVTVKYKYSAGYADIREKSDISFTMSPVYAQSKAWAVDFMRKTLGITDVSHFDIVLHDFKTVNSEKFNLGDKIILHASGYSYAYDKSDSAVLMVEYEEFDYKDYSMRITNNLAGADNLTVDVYTADVDTSGGKYTLTYGYDYLKSVLLGKCKWIVNLNAATFNADGVITAPDGVNVTVGENAVTISVYQTDVDLLKNLRICAVAEITENVDVQYVIDYKAFEFEDNGTITVKDVTSEPYTVGLSTLNILSFTNFMSKHGDLINNAVKIGDNTVKHYIPDSVSVNYGDDLNRVIVGYTYKTIICLRSDLVEPVYLQIDHFGEEFNYSALGLSVPTGFRVKSMTADSSAVTVAFDENDVAATKITVNTVNINADNVVYVDVAFSDKYFVKVEYLENYMFSGKNGISEQSGFAVKKTMEKEVPVTDFADINNPTEEELQKFLNMKSLTVIGAFGQFTGAAVTFDSPKYTMKLSYSTATANVINTDGTILPTCHIPLMSFSKVASDLGKDWSIMVLNTKEKIVFKSEADVKESDLYGYFFVAVFKEQVSNLDALFGGLQSNGCRSFFMAKKVKGGVLYNYCVKSGIVGALFSGLGNQLISATIESLFEENGTYYSYFTFIDGSSTLAYTSNSKADSFFNDKSAFENTLDSAGEDFSNFWNSNSTGAVALKLVLGVLGLLAIGYLITLVSPYLIRLFDLSVMATNDVRAHMANRKQQTPVEPEKPKTKPKAGNKPNK